MTPAVRRSAVAVAAALAVALLVLPAPVAVGAGGKYVVVQCHPLNRGHQATLADSTPYSVHTWCSNGSRAWSIQINNVDRAAHDTSGRARWSVPGSASLGIVGADVQAKLRNDGGHRARLYVADSEGRETARVGRGDRGPASFRRYVERFPRAVSFLARLRCHDGGGCASSDQAKNWVRDVKLTVADFSDPRFVQVDGSLLGSGWLRGAHNLNAFATDAGAGLKRIVATVNGTLLARAPGHCSGVIAGTSLASRFVPCSANGELRINANTARAPFRDGSNSLSVCSLDFAGNRACDWRTVQIDNTPPGVAFANSQDSEDPELIRAPVTDPHSGVASGRIWFRGIGQPTWRALGTSIAGGELRARVNSAAFRPGDYEFMAEASDVAGNAVETTHRQDGQPMVLEFPLRAAVALSAHLGPGGSRRQTIPYGRDSRVAGRLVSPEAEPLADQQVTVEENFGEGALIDRRVRTVTTDAEGRWSSTLPAGPSRTVRALYAGTPKYLGDQETAGRVRVRSKASFRTSRKRVPEGKRIVFKGKVGHRGARIPTGGKLIELQVRERAGGWNTVRQAFHTRSNGRYRLGYRFGSFYRADARFRFRVKVAREEPWPYKAPATSRSRKVIVEAR